MEQSNPRLLLLPRPSQCPISEAEHQKRSLNGPSRNWMNTRPTKWSKLLRNDRKSLRRIFESPVLPLSLNWLSLNWLSLNWLVQSMARVVFSLQLQKTSSLARSATSHCCHHRHFQSQSSPSALVVCDWKWSAIQNTSLSELRHLLVHTQLLFPPQPHLFLNLTTTTTTTNSLPWNKDFTCRWEEMTSTAAARYLLLCRLDVLLLFLQSPCLQCHVPFRVMI